MHERSTQPGPLIVLTVADPRRQAEPEIAASKNQLYADGIRRQGGRALLLDATAPAADRTTAFAAMDGLVITGGADIEPSRYGQPVAGAVDLEPERDELEANAWAAAVARSVPVLGICRGFQAINVFSGGTLLQDVASHTSASWSHGPARTHPLRLVPGSRLARILSPTNSRGGTIEVNTYHHQAVRAGDLAPTLTASAWAASPAGDLVEGFESTAGQLILAVQCHPERTESTPPAFERLWRVFVDACRGPATERFPA